VDLTSERPFAYDTKHMYAAGYGIKKLRATRAGGYWRAWRAVAVLVAVVVASLGLALVAHGGSTPVYTEVVVQPGDTLWSIASERYPSDDVRVRVDEIERLNGLQSPVIQVGETLRLPV
jgi:nucleoid-associated protein YgaU